MKGIAFALILASGALNARAELAIANVRANVAAIDPVRGEALTVSFVLSEAAAVTLKIYDARNNLVRGVPSATSLSAGEHVLVWDATDVRGRTVPPEAYAYTLEALSPGGATVVYDLADVTGGNDIVPRDVRWDAETGLLSYVLDSAARVRVRIGMLNDGPLLRTLIDWVPRTGGYQEEKWDGFDSSRVLDVARHPSIFFGVQAFALPVNSVLVGPRVDEVRTIDDIPIVERPLQSVQSAQKRMYAPAQQAFLGRGDLTVTLSVPENLPRNRDGLPIVHERVPIRLDVPASDMDRALARRFEPVFFVDGQFAFENEVGFVPMTWMWDPVGVNAGEHYLTVNLRGYEGNFGIATVKVAVERRDAAARNR